MLDIKLIREQPDFVKAELAKSGVDAAEVDRCSKPTRAGAACSTSSTRCAPGAPASRKELGKASPEEREREARRDARAWRSDLRGRARIGRSRAAVRAADARDAQPAASVRARRQERERTTRSCAAKASRANSTSSRSRIGRLGERLGIIDFERGVKLSGTRFHVLVGAGRAAGARADRLDARREDAEQGYLEVAPPLMVNQRAGDRHRSSAEVRRHDVSRYRGGLLVHPDRRAAADQSLSRRNPRRRHAADLPDRVHAMLSAREDVGRARRARHQARPSVRQGRDGQAGAPETSDEELDKLVENACEVCRRLEIPFRVVQMCTGDLGFRSAATYDVEMWAPGSAEWLEVSSCSNCTDFQARRANIRFRRKRAASPNSSMRSTARVWDCRAH